MSSTYHTTEGIVLKKTPYGEADFLVRVLTLDFGKIDLRARGARKQNSKLNPHLDFLDIASLSFVKNGDSIPTIIDSEKNTPNHFWFTSAKNLLEAANMVSTIDCLIPFEVKDSKVFYLSKNFFEGGECGAESFLGSLIIHEGYGTVLSLPSEAQNFIISKWPALKI